MLAFPVENDGVEEVPEIGGRGAGTWRTPGEPYSQSLLKSTCVRIANLLVSPSLLLHFVASLIPSVLGSLRTFGSVRAGIYRSWIIGSMFGLGNRKVLKYSAIDTSFSIDVEDTVTCFCRKARRKEKDAGTTEDPKLYLEEAALERQLPELDLRMLVDLPPGLDYNEWLASHTLALFDHINLVYGTISEFCTMTGCPDMTGPGLRTYLWFDEKGKKTRVAAPQYIDYVMTFTQRTVSDETIFPTKYANEFPSSFESIVRKILRLLYHVVAHIYHCHFREVALLGLHAHLNCVFAHLTLLNQRFNLIDPKETEILGDLEAALLGDSTSSSAPSQTLAIQETSTTAT